MASVGAMSGMSGMGLGTLRFYQQAGAPFAEMAMNALKPALAATAVTKYLGASLLWSLATGVLMVAGLFGFAVAMGWLVVRYHVYQDAIRSDWRNNPLASRQIELLEQINEGVREPKMVVVS